jgi:hypothetical protein
LITPNDSGLNSLGTQPHAEVNARAALLCFMKIDKRTPMTTEPKELISVRLKLERANQHIIDLERATRIFLDTSPYKIGTKHDPQTRKLIYYITSAEDIPTNIPIITGDVIQTLRSALDHLAYQLFLAGMAGTGGSAKHIHFPIFGDAAKYEAGKTGKVKGMRPDAIKAIDEIEPYKGGKGERIWMLNQLSIADKHRLVITVGAALQGTDLGAHVSRHLQQMIRQTQRTVPDYPVPVPPTMHVLFKTDPMMCCPLKVGDTLFTDAPDAEVNEEMQFQFDIALNEPGIIEGKPLLETLHQLANLIDDIITNLGGLI